MTKMELIRGIKVKVQTAKPIPKNYFYKLLEQSNKSQLNEIFKKVNVSGDGNDISLV